MASPVDFSFRGVASYLPLATAAAALLLFAAPPAAAQPYLYFTNFSDGTIERTDLDGSNRVVLVPNGPSGAQFPFDIVVDPGFGSGGAMFWTENECPRDPNCWKQSMHRAIKRARLDGSDVTTLFDSRSLGMPRGIAIDTREKRLYWIDGNVWTCKDNNVVAGACFGGGIRLTSVIQKSSYIGLKRSTVLNIPLPEHVNARDGGGTCDVIASCFEDAYGPFATYLTLNRARDRLFWSVAEPLGKDVGTFRTVPEAVQSATLDGADVQTVLNRDGGTTHPTVQPWGIAFDPQQIVVDDYIYLAHDVVRDLAQQVLEFTEDGATTRNVLTIGANLMRAIAVDGKTGTVYYTKQSGSNGIWMTPLSGTGPAQQILAHDAIFGLAVMRPECNDQIDNDLDGGFDLTDVGCTGNTLPEVQADLSERDATLVCDDGLDNDGDELIDLDDPGCLGNPVGASEDNPMCNDGLDNDLDGLVDYPDDPGCSSLQDFAEEGFPLARLPVSDDQNDDEFGTSIDVSGDVAIVGATGVDVGGTSDIGAVYLYRRSALGEWTEEQKIEGPPGSESFGTAVAISGDVAVVGAPSGLLGGANVYRYDGSSWAFEQTLTAGGAGFLDGYGAAVAVSGDVAVVGAPLASVGANASQGTAYVFRYDGAGWALEQQLEAADSDAADLFGAAVSVSGDVVAVGAEFASVRLPPLITGLDTSDVGQSILSGHAYVFRYDGTQWNEESVPLGSEAQVLDRAGASVDVWGNRLVVGAPWFDGAFGSHPDAGGAIVYEYADGSWAETALLQALDRREDDHLGESVAVQGDTIVVGASGKQIGGYGDAGVAYVFRQDPGGQWSQLRRLSNSDGTAVDALGSAVGVWEEAVLAGAPLALGATARGHAYPASVPRRQEIAFAPSSARAGDSIAFARGFGMVGLPEGTLSTPSQGTAKVYLQGDLGAFTWQQVAELEASDAMTGDRFGASVAVATTHLVAGAPGVDTDRGATYTFEALPSSQLLEQKLQASDGVVGDLFGAAVGVSPTRLLVGAPARQVGANSAQGSVYEYTFSGLTWTEQPARLTASDGGADDQFGSAIAMDGDMAAVGLCSPTGVGAVYLFEHDGVSWIEAQKLQGAVGGFPGDGFGCSLGLSGDSLIVGAPVEEAAYVYAFDGSTWNEQQVLFNPESGSAFGSAVDIEGASALVGAAGALPSAAYLFRFDGSTWNASQRLVAEEGVGPELGRAVSLFDDWAMVGAPEDGPTSLGAAYAFHVPRRIDVGPGLADSLFEGVSGLFGMDFVFPRVLDPGILAMQSQRSLLDSSSTLFPDAKLFGTELASDVMQIWDVKFTGILEDDAELSVHYDDSLLRIPEEDLVLCRAERAPCVPLPVVARDTVGNVLTVRVSDPASVFLLLSGPPVTVDRWLIQGTASGGTIEFTVGLFRLSLTTVAGDSAEQVAQQLASLLSANGIPASADGPNLQVDGAVLTSFDILDPGLSVQETFLAVPTLRSSALAMLALLVAGVSFVLLRRRARVEAA